MFKDTILTGKQMRGTGTLKDISILGMLRVSYPDTVDAECADAVPDRDGKTKLWYIVDRKKEMIKVRGFQVSPSEVEGVLLTHPDIIDAAVIGVAAVKLSDGEEPRAYVNLMPGSRLSERGIRDFLKERLARYKQCSGGIVIGKEIPKSMSGKKLKRLLVEQAKLERASEQSKAKI